MGGWGGRRPGAGRKPKSKRQQELDGTKSQARVLPHPSAPPPAGEAVEEFDAPDDLTFEERAVWMEQAPHAFRNRTLTKASALAFRRYCGLVVLEREQFRNVESRGGADHGRTVKLVNGLELQFNLTAAGKPMHAAEPVQKPQSALSRFRG